MSTKVLGANGLVGAIDAPLGDCFLGNILEIFSNCFSKEFLKLFLYDFAKVCVKILLKVCHFIT